MLATIQVLAEADSRRVGIAQQARSLTLASGRAQVLIRMQRARLHVKLVMARGAVLSPTKLIPRSTTLTIVVALFSRTLDAASTLRPRFGAHQHQRQRHYPVLRTAISASGNAVPGTAILTHCSVAQRRH